MTGDRTAAVRGYKDIIDRFPEGTYASYVKQRAEVPRKAASPHRPRRLRRRRPRMSTPSKSAAPPTPAASTRRPPNESRLGLRVPAAPRGARGMRRPAACGLGRRFLECGRARSPVCRRSRPVRRDPGATPWRILGLGGARGLVRRLGSGSGRTGSEGRRTRRVGQARRRPHGPRACKRSGQSSRDSPREDPRLLSRGRILERNVEPRGARDCTRVWASPASSVDAIGLAAQTIYFHKLLAEDLGLDVDFLQVGRFKGAEEPFTRDGPSDEARQSLETTLADACDERSGIDSVHGGRPNASPAAVEDGPYTAQGAKLRGLVDDVGYFDEAKDGVERTSGTSRVEVRLGGAAPAGFEGEIDDVLRVFTGDSLVTAPIALVRADRRDLARGWRCSRPR